MLACLGKLAALVLDFVEQPYVLNGDHRLIGKGADKLDLLIGKRLDPLSRDCDHADRHLLA